MKKRILKLLTIILILITLTFSNFGIIGINCLCAENNEIITDADFTLSKTELTTANKNFMRININLRADNKEYALCKNPIINIKFPDIVEDVQVNNIAKLNASEFELQNINFDKETKILNLAYNGEQKEYGNSIYQGMYIEIDTSIELNKMVNSKNNKIEMQYINENAKDTVCKKSIDIKINNKKTSDEEYIKENNIYDNDIANVEKNSQNLEGKDIKEVEGLEVNYVAISAGKELKDQEEIKEGQTIKYRINVKNISGNDIANIKLHAEQSNATFFGEEKVPVIGPVPDEPYYDTYIAEDEKLTNKELVKDVIKNGESLVFEYEFTVKNADKTEGILKISADNYEEKEIKLYTNKIKEAKLKAVLKNAMSEDMKIYSTEFAWRMQARVTNLENKKLENIIVEIPLQKWVKTSEIEITELMNENTKYEFLNYEEKEDTNVIRFKIPKIEKGEEIVIGFPLSFINMDQRKLTDEFKLNFIAYLEKEKEGKYISNEIDKEVKQDKIPFNITLNSNKQENQVLEKGENILFEAIVKNDGAVEKKVNINNCLSEGLDIVNYSCEQNGIKEEVNNGDTLEKTLKTGESLKVYATTKVNDNIEKDTVSYKLEVIGEGVYEETKELSYKINVVNKEENDNNVKVTVATTTDGEEEGTKDNEKYEISGVVWEDVNKNGNRENNNKGLEGIKVYLLDANAGNVIKAQTITDTNGKYKFDAVLGGKYIIGYEYDNNKYRTTTYEKAKVSKVNNSNAVSKMVTINGQTKQMAVTDILNLTDTSVAYINLGLVKDNENNMAIKVILIIIIILTFLITINIVLKKRKEEKNEK